MTYTLSINNKKVYDFYNINKHVSFEDMSCIMVDVLSKILTKPDSSLDSNFAEKLLISMNNLDSKISNIDQCMSDIFENKFDIVMNLAEMSLKDILNMK